MSPEIQSCAVAWPSQASANPVTSPTIGLLSGGPWRQGVPVTVMGGLPSCSSVVVSYSPSPTAPPPSRPAPATVVITVADAQQLAAGGVQVVVVLVVAEQHRVDRADVVGRDRRPGQLVRRGAPAELVVAPGGSKVGIGQQPPAADLQQDRRAPDVGDPNVGHRACSTAHSSTSSAIFSQPSAAIIRCGPSYSVISVTVSDL